MHETIMYFLLCYYCYATAAAAATAVVVNCGFVLLLLYEECRIMSYAMLRYRLCIYMCGVVSLIAPRNLYLQKPVILLSQLPLL
jgi:hypothetical protein